MSNKVILYIILLVVSLIVLYAARTYCILEVERHDAEQMHRAVQLTERWFSLIEQEKLRRGIKPEIDSASAHSGMLGIEYTEITTTLGSLDAKRLTLNPDFAALILRLVHDAGIDTNAVVAVTLSGSFPALGIATLAALQTIKVNAVLFSSLGASSYGANQPGMTWIDIEHTLRKEGGLQCTSEIVSLGATDDSGGGLSEEGIQLLKEAAARNSVSLTIPSTLKESTDQRLQILLESKIALLINIGGSHYALGNCSHGSVIPNGFNRTMEFCTHEDRGLIVRVNEKGIPFIHMLNLRGLAAKYGMPLEFVHYSPMEQLYYEHRVSKIPLALLLLLLLLLFIYLRKWLRNS
ncbi:MAG: poly-gamma-glutamate system protein [bacterium]